MDGGTLIIMQEDGARISLNELGSVCISLPVKRTSDRMMQGLIYESVLEQFRDALDYASWTLDHIDPMQRLAHVALAANLTGADHMSWRTQRESDASPNSMNMSMGNNERTLVQDNRPRAALRLNGTQIVEDLVIQLRRQWR